MSEADSEMIFRLLYCVMIFTGGFLVGRGER